MQDLRDLKDEDLQGLTPEAVTTLAQQMLQHIQRQAQDIRLKDAKLEKLTFELARHKAWKFGAKSEAMSAEQHRLFEETLAEDEAALQALLEQAKGTPPEDNAASSKRKPRRQPLPDHLCRVQHNHEPQDTACPSPGCGEPVPVIERLLLLHPASLTPAAT